MPEYFPKDTTVRASIPRGRSFRSFPDLFIFASANQKSRGCDPSITPLLFLEIGSRLFSFFLPVFVQKLVGKGTRQNAGQNANGNLQGKIL